MKIAGLRIDLNRLERLLADQGIPALAVDAGDLLGIAVLDGHDPDQVERLLAGEYRLPRAAIRARAVDELPRLRTGKPDYAATPDALAGLPVAGRLPRLRAACLRGGRDRVLAAGDYASRVSVRAARQWRSLRS